MGFGVVGSGVVSLIERNREGIKKRRHNDLQVKYILDIRDFPDSPYAEMLTKNFDDILNDESVKIVVECMGGLHPAYEFVSACLKAGKSVVSSNKLLVAEMGYELLELAEQNNVNFLFEASVGGGIPILRPISQCLAANEIEEIAGILNGTTNFILTKMITDNMNFDEALRLAQENGYAEADPTADIEGHDACRKICILASIAFGNHVYPAGVHTEGITKLTSADVDYAKAAGGVIKLIANVKKLSEDKISIMTAPAVVMNSSQLASVSDVFNAVLVRGDATGDVVFYGKGAGRFATASAVVADVVDCAVHIQRKKYFGWGPEKANYIQPYEETEQQFMVRACAADAEATLEKIHEVFGGIKQLRREGAEADEICFITCSMTPAQLKEKLAGLPIIVENTVRLVNY